jgi:hypothetical protein
VKTPRYPARSVLELLGNGRISLSKAAELLDSNPLAVIEKARERGVGLGAGIAAYRAAQARETVLARERPKPYRARRKRSRSRTSSPR